MISASGLCIVAVYESSTTRPYNGAIPIFGGQTAVGPKKPRSGKLYASSKRNLPTIHMKTRLRKEREVYMKLQGSLNLSCTQVLLDIVRELFPRIKGSAKSINKR